MLGQWARLFTQLTTFRTMTCFGESNGSAVLGYNTSVPSDPLMDVCMATARRRNESAECEYRAPLKQREP